MRLTLENVDQFCSGVVMSDNSPVIDLSRITFIEPYGLIYLSMFIRYHNRHNMVFRIITPHSTSVTKYLSSQRFWDRNNIVGNDPRLAPNNKAGRSTSFNDIIEIERGMDAADDIGLKVFDKLSKSSVGIQVSLVAELATELVDNFSLHSGEQLAACVLQLYPNLRRVDFAIGDCGIGIRDSLAENPKYGHLATAPHRTAALKALEDGVTGRHEGGTGFGTIRENIIELNGQMFLSTGDGWIQIVSDQDGVLSGDGAYDLAGVQIEISIPTGG